MAALLILAGMAALACMLAICLLAITQAVLRSTPSSTTARGATTRDFPPGAASVQGGTPAKGSAPAAHPTVAGKPSRHAPTTRSRADWIERDYAQRTDASTIAFRAQRGHHSWRSAAVQLRAMRVPLHRALPLLKGAMRRQRLDRALHTKLNRKGD